MRVSTGSTAFWLMGGAIRFAGWCRAKGLGRDANGDTSALAGRGVFHGIVQRFLNNEMDLIAHWRRDGEGRETVRQLQPASQARAGDEVLGLLCEKARQTLQRVVLRVQRPDRLPHVIDQ